MPSRSQQNSSLDLSCFIPDRKKARKKGGGQLRWPPPFPRKWENVGGIALVLLFAQALPVLMRIHEDALPAHSANDRERHPPTRFARRRIHSPRGRHGQGDARNDKIATSGIPNAGTGKVEIRDHVTKSISGFRGGSPRPDGDNRRRHAHGQKERYDRPAHPRGPDDICGKGEPRKIAGIHAAFRHLVVSVHRSAKVNRTHPNRSILLYTWCWQKLASRQEIRPRVKFSLDDDSKTWHDPIWRRGVVEGRHPNDVDVQPHLIGNNTRRA